MNINKADLEILESFFTNRIFNEEKPYLTLEETWKSLEEIKRDTDDNSIRPLQRLQKLVNFGLVDIEIINYKGRYDHFYFITLEGIYVILVHQSEKEILSFVKSNIDVIPGFSEIYKLNPDASLKLRYFIGHIITMIEHHDYFLIEYFLKKWFKDNYGARVILKFFQPNLKEKLKGVYNHDQEFLKELQKQYGR